MAIGKFVYYWNAVIAILFVQMKNQVIPSTAIQSFSTDYNSTNWTSITWQNVSCPTPCSCLLQWSSSLSESVNLVNCSWQSIINAPKLLPFESESIDLSHNLIEDLHEHLPQLEHLQELNLSHNLINYLGRGHTFNNLTHIKLLDISHNKYRTLFASVFRGLKRLEILYLNDGQLKHIDEHAFDGLEMLKELYLQNNHLSSIYLELFQSVLNLSILNVGSNSISHLTGGMFTSLTVLRKLILSNNRIVSINDNAFVGLDQLEELYLDDNQMVKVPSIAIQSLKRIISIYLDGNEFGQLSTGDFVHTPAMHISITHCTQLVLIDRGAFWDLPNVRSILLHNNPLLQYIDSQAFFGVPTIHLIELHNNSLKTFQHDIINNIYSENDDHYNKRGIQITFDGNHLLCDCNVHYLYQCLKDNNRSQLEIIDGNNLTCFQPLNLYGTKLSEISANQIEAECAPQLMTITQSNITIHKKIGDRHVFHCRALGIPTPRIYWILPSGEIINETSNQVHLQLKGAGSLRMYHLKPRDSGVYKCIAENAYGKVFSSIQLLVDDIDLHLFAITISSTFVTLVWNGTARNLFHEYQLLYYKIDENQLLSNNSNYETVTVNHFLRSYTINSLHPNQRYKICISIRDDDIATNIQLSCTIIQTATEFIISSMAGGLSNVAMALTLSVAVVMLFVICLSVCAARKFNKKHQYETPHKALVDNMISIPLENMCSPLMTYNNSNNIDATR